ncbi:hypothetical protein OG413_35535 [Streptomyces sp. NBC_01433]|uniref:hypothetical protein n=1 Tax=Streptomyces sp. NBC_01433 TaxID=2903864 RepID=UPI00225A81AD|nr:hypothetical protein [Streptomyces sp. NBC_01433]MCX4680529.1 hypothetical protein [Streptomyces sp. NBC_01433]
MLQFDDVVNAPVGKMKAAADDWAAMLSKLEQLAEDARTGMKAKADKAEWEGVNAGVTKSFIAKTAKEFEDAAAQARGIKLLLADAHTSFKFAQDELVRIRDNDAPAAGVVVSATGKVSPQHDLETDTAARHDPDYSEALRKQKAAVTSWQTKIDRIVEDCSDADESLKLALEANVKDEHDFSAPKYSSLDAEQVDRAAALTKQATGEGGTARNVEALRKLEEIIDDNRDDPEFATGFYRKLGAEGTLEAYTRMSLDATSLGPAGQDRAAMVRNIQNDMGAMLGLATTPSIPNHLDATWTTQLMKAGRKEIDVSGFAGVNTKVYGYQALGSLLREGTYDKQFLTSVGRDMIAMDKKNPQIWSENLPYDQNMAINLDSEGGRGFNPVTGLMEALSKNPGASSELFNENMRDDTNKDGIVTLSDKETGGKKAESVVDYMLDKNATSDWYDTAVGGESTPGQTAMGNALEAAVTGRVPGDDDAPPVRHTKDMSQVMEKVVEKIGTNPELVSAKAGDPPGPLSALAPQFGAMAAEYMPDLQATAENAAGQIKPIGVPADFDKALMARFLGSVAQDPQAYGAISHAQQAYTTALVSDAFQHPERHVDMGDAVRNAVHPGGEIAGIMTEARAHAVHELKTHEESEYSEGVADNAKWTNRVIDLVGGKYLEMIPVGGDVVTWIQEDVADAVVKSAEDDKSDAARIESGSGYVQAEGAAKTASANAVAAAGKAAGMTPDEYRDHQGTASTATAAAHSTGRDLVASTSR